METLLIKGSKGLYGKFLKHSVMVASREKPEHLFCLSDRIYGYTWQKS